ncbi:MAG: hypothetical protein VCC02_01730 [Myxococcota bacterium]|jgi:hypothetical protein|nr:hypothetical protein [Erythrobacter sp.]
MADSEENVPAEDNDEPRGTLDTTSVLYVVCGIPVVIIFLVGLFSLVGACDQMNIMVPA